jgi:glutamate formiminotransferase / 5-formyltetrahydrofolate cyclo-ligase
LTLLAVPNVSEGRDAVVIGAVQTAFEPCLIDTHSDRDHNRSVFTLTAPPGTLAEAVLAGAAVAVDRIDVTRQTGEHPRVGAIDVAPIVYLAAAQHGAACAEALLLADLLGERLSLPVFLYGELGAGRTRAELRRGGPQALGARIEAGELAPDFGPRRLHPTAGAVLVAARPPLIAFNVELSPPAGLDDARRVAAHIRESADGGLPGVRAIGLWLERRGVAQVSMNLEDYRRAGPADVVAAIARVAPVAETELVGLAPRAAFDGFPDGVLVRNLRTFEDALEG